MARLGAILPSKSQNLPQNPRFSALPPAQPQKRLQTPNFVAPTDANQVDEEKDPNPTLKTAVCCRGLQQEKGGVARSETRSLISTLIRIPKRMGERLKKFRMRRMSRSREGQKDLK